MEEKKTTPLRQRMIEDMNIRGLCEKTQRTHIRMLFARLKRILGLGRFRLRGPCGANDEFLLAATAQNLRKLAKLLPMPKAPRPA